VAIKHLVRTVPFIRDYRSDKFRPCFPKVTGLLLVEGQRRFIGTQIVDGIQVFGMRRETFG
jgi:hypothetical protein